MHHKAYVFFDDLQEKYEVETPVLSLHNIVGTPYVDIGGSMKAILVPPEGKSNAPVKYQCTLRMTKIGWFSGDE